MSENLLPSGYLLNSRYRIIKMRGEGGMSFVYHALDQQENKECAIKQLKKSQNRKTVLNYFRQEADLLKKLSHTNLPKIFDSFGENGSHYIVMEYIDGLTPEEYIEKTKQALSSKVVLSITEQMCDVLHYLHTQQPPIIFRDMKPENIMLETNSDRIKLIDLGIARLHTSGRTRDTHFAGTKSFMSPEAMDNELSDPRSDIYSLGMTLYYLLTADEPPDDIEGKMQFSPLYKLVSYNDTPELNEIIIKATKPDPRERWQSVQDMLAALSRFNNNAPSDDSAKPAISGFIRRTTEFLVQHFTTTQLTILAVILIAIVSTLTILFGSWMRMRFPLLWQLFPFFYAIGPFVYAVSNRRGVAGVTHFFLQMIIGSVILSNLGLDGHFVVAIVSALAMELGLGISNTRKSKLWRCIFATALSVATTWGAVWYIGGEFIDPIQIIGGGIAGFVAYYMGEVMIEAIRSFQEVKASQKSK